MKIKIKIIFLLVLVASAFGFHSTNALQDVDSVVDPKTNVSVDTITKSLQLNLPSVTLLPDSPLYQLKSTWEAIQLFLSKTPEQKIETLIRMSQSRLAEAFQLYTKNKDTLAVKTLNEFTATINEAKDLSNETLQKKGGVNNFANKLKVEESKFEMLNLITGEYRIRRMK